VLLDREMDRHKRRIKTCGQVEKLVEWITAQGVPIPSAAKAEIEELLEADDLPAHVRKALELRQEGAKTSVTKLNAFLKRAGAGERIRGAFLFCAAGTGAGLRRRAASQSAPAAQGYGDAHVDLQTLFENFRHGDPEWLRFNYGDDSEAAAPDIRPLRSFLWAAPGHELVVADYRVSRARSRVFAGEQWKVDAMFALMRDDSLPDLYRRAAAGIFNTTTDLLTKKDPRRQVGKVSELSLRIRAG